MDTIYIKLIDSSEQIPFVMTYGLHKELQEYLLENDRLFNIFTDTEIADEVIKISLSKRNDMGQITVEFVEIQQVMAEDIILLLNTVFDYFSDFFLKNSEKIQKLSQNLNQISKQSQLS